MTDDEEQQDQEEEGQVQEVEVQARDLETGAAAIPRAGERRTGSAVHERNGTSHRGL